MPMSREEHEKLLTELLAGEIEHSRKTAILQELRTDYGTVHADFTDLETSNAKFRKDNDDLIVSNSQLFRQAGIVGANEKDKEVEKEKEFSETVTLEQLERGIN